MNIRLLTYILLCAIQLPGSTATPANKVCINNACVLAEVADSEEDRQLGLMFRESLADNQGMLFIFNDEARHAFWMKNMRFPLDIIWISGDKQIVDIKTNVPPCDESCVGLEPRVPARYVLETPAGFIERNRVKIGQQAVF